jgi:hypothetical protein
MRSEEHKRGSNRRREDKRRYRIEDKRREDNLR